MDGQGQVELLSSPTPTVQPTVHTVDRQILVRADDTIGGMDGQAKLLLLSSPTNQPSAASTTKSWDGRMTQSVGWMAKRPRGQVVVVSTPDRACRGPPNLGTDGQAKLLLLSSSLTNRPHRGPPNLGGADDTVGGDGWPSQAKLSSSPTNRPYRGLPNLGRG
ncbi:hypothetical protein [Mollivirus kamchatka]|nr:hypothetical protein [Mollivirus kamchatka]